MVKAALMIRQIAFNVEAEKKGDGIVFFYDIRWNC